MTNKRTVKRIIKINKAELNIIQKGSHLAGGLELRVSHHEPPAQRCHSLHPLLRISFNSLSPHLLTASSSSLTSPAPHSFAPHGHRHFRSPWRRPIPSCFRSPSGGRNASPNQPRRISWAIRKPKQAETTTARPLWLPLVVRRGSRRRPLILSLLEFVSRSMRSGRMFLHFCFFGFFMVVCYCCLL